jgi:hypothetical protein
MNGINGIHNGVGTGVNGMDIDEEPHERLVVEDKGKNPVSDGSSTPVVPKRHFFSSGKPIISSNNPSATSSTPMTKPPQASSSRQPLPASEDAVAEEDNSEDTEDEETEQEDNEDDRFQNGMGAMKEKGEASWFKDVTMLPGFGYNWSDEDEEVVDPRVPQSRPIGFGTRRSDRITLKFEPWNGRPCL